MVTLKTPTWGTSQTLRLFYELVQETETETEKLKAGKKNCAEVVTFPPYQEKLPTFGPQWDALWLSGNQECDTYWPGGINTIHATFTEEFGI